MSTDNTYSQAGNQYPNLVGNPYSLVAAPGSSCSQNGGTPSQVHTLSNWFNKCAFANPGNGVYGTAHRNSLYGPDYSNLNLSFGKTFSVSERYKLEIRADAQNALNHASFAAPDSSIEDTKAAFISGVTDGGRHIQGFVHFSF
jgi:hypothetical protein